MRKTEVTEFRAIKYVTVEDYIEMVGSMSWCKCCCTFFLLLVLVLYILIGGFPGIIPLVNKAHFE